MPYHFVGIDHVQLAAPKGCEEEARNFYHGLLGMEEIEKPEKLKTRGGVWFQCGKQQVHIGVENDFNPAKKAHPAFEVHNVSALQEHLAQLIPVQEDYAVEGVKRIFVEDPFGNRIEFLERIREVAK
ncbi:VOC family protein [Paenibacillus eucommiae]|nr:VOC family protein [Paenibacillus eucommiae]